MGGAATLGRWFARYTAHLLRLLSHTTFSTMSMPTTHSTTPLSRREPFAGHHLISSPRQVDPAHHAGRATFTPTPPLFLHTSSIGPSSSLPIIALVSAHALPFRGRTDLVTACCSPRQVDYAEYAGGLCFSPPLLLSSAHLLEHLFPLPIIGHYPDGALRRALCVVQLRAWQRRLRLWRPSIWTPHPH